MRTNYEAGREFEWKIQKDLERRGFVTIRAAGSAGEAKVDIIAVDPLGVHLWIQAKADGRIGPTEWNTLRMCSGWAGATPILARKGPRGIFVIYEELLQDKIPYSRSKTASRLYMFTDVDTIQQVAPTDTEGQVHA
jgi:Holliday junction resolvase